MITQQVDRSGKDTRAGESVGEKSQPVSEGIPLDTTSVTGKPELESVCLPKVPVVPDRDSGLNCPANDCSSTTKAAGSANSGAHPSKPRNTHHKRPKDLAITAAAVNGETSSEESFTRTRNLPFPLLNKMLGLPTSTVAHSFSGFVRCTRELVKPEALAKISLSISNASVDKNLEFYRPVVTARATNAQGSSVTFAFQVGETYYYNDKDSDVKSVCVAAHALLILKRDLERALPGVSSIAPPKGILDQERGLLEVAEVSKKYGISEDQVEKLLVPWQEGKPVGLFSSILSWISGASFRTS